MCIRHVVAVNCLDSGTYAEPFFILGDKWDEFCVLTFTVFLKIVQQSHRAIILDVKV